MAYAFPSYAREVLEQVVREPRFRKLTTIPVFAWQAIGLFLFMFTGYGLSTYFYLQGEIHWGVATALNSFMAFLAFTILHDSTHRAVSGNRFFNDLLGTMANFMMLPGVTARVFRYLHMEHHRYTGDEVKDPDEFMVSAKGLMVPFALAYVELSWVPWYLKRWNSRPVKERIEFTVGIALYTLWHVVWLTSPYALEFVLIWMIPQRLGLMANAYLLARIQHPEGVIWEQNPFQCTVKIESNKLQKFMMLGQTVHCLHHLLPSVPFFRYHAAWDAGKHLFDEQNVPVGNFRNRPMEIIFREEPKSRWLDAEVTSIRDVAQGIREFTLTPRNGATFPSFSAGAHIDVHVEEGLIRQYSLSNSSGDSDRYVIAVKKEVDGRGGSRAMHENITVGQTIEISEPRNNFALTSSATDYVLVAGGIGITPILGMAHELYERGASFEMHICARDQANLPFADSLSALPFADRIKVYLSDEDPDQRFVPEKAAGLYENGRELYICGPSGFMEWVESTLTSGDWPNQAIISETFVAREIDVSENKAFEVELASSGKILTVQPDQFLLDVLNDNGAGVICSCTQGICGSCITPVLSGEPEHRDVIMTDAERAANDKMCVCVGRAKSGSRLVLDL